MRQVPHYLLIGNGHVARHFQHYFSLLSLSFDTWNRAESLNLLQERLQQASHILLLINDDVINDFFVRHLKHTTALSIHFSGSLISDEIHGAHPLLSFGTTFYTLEKYQSVPFIIDHDAPDFAHLLPGLSNQHVRLHKSKKSKYHALCVMSGNFSCMLWQKFFASLEHEFNIPHAMGFPYLFQQTQNLFTQYETALTGPLVRQDVHTIEKNLQSLAEDHFQDIYKSFVACYQSVKEGAR